MGLLISMNDDCGSESQLRQEMKSQVLPRSGALTSPFQGAGAHRGGPILISETYTTKDLQVTSGKSFMTNLAAKMDYIGYLEDENCYVNLTGYYGYLENAYYASQELKAEDKDIHPTCGEVLDAYVVPIFLEKAKLAGLPVPEYYVTNGYFEPPVIVDSMNPFMSRQSVVLRNGHQERVAKSMTRNFTYAICCQDFPEGAKIGNFRSILGWSAKPQFQPLAEAVWRVFHIPLAIVRIIILENGEMMLSNLQPLPFVRLSPRELRYIESRVQWPI
jgi:hypothetical protein